MAEHDSSREDLPAPAVSSLEDERRKRRFDEFVRTHRGFLLGLATKLCRSQFDPNDLVQDVLERTWKHFDKIPEEANPRAWLARVMQNLFVDWIRKRRSNPPRVSIDDTPVAAPVPEIAEWWTELGAEDVRARVNELGSELRGVFELHAFESCSYEEISRRLSIPKATVGTRLLRARRKLKRLLGAGREAEDGDDD